MQETEADTLGLDAMKRAGLDVQAPGQLWAAAFEEERVNPPGFLSGIFASHPATEARRDRLQALGKEGGGDSGKSRFEAVIAKHRASWLADELSRRNYAQSEVMLARLLKTNFQQHEIYTAQAELFRRRAKPGDLQKAVNSYRLAAKDPRVAAIVFRDLGTSYQKLGDRAQAQSAFREYLKRAPKASDALMIQSYLDK
jgi:beta-barrel assembly-enhancing protease